MRLWLLSGRLLRRGLTGTVMLLLGIAMFEFINPVIGGQLGGAAGVQDLFDQLPPGLRTIAQVDENYFITAGFAGYVALGFTHPLYLVLISSTMVGFSARSLAGEIDSGTIVLTLSRPISRRRAYAARAVDVTVLAVGLGIAGAVGAWAGIQFTDFADAIDDSHLLPLVGAAALLAWAVGSMTLGASAAASSTGRVVGWATAVLVIFYFVDYFAEIWDVLEPIGPFTIFRYFDPTAAFVEGRIPLINVAVLGGIGLISLVVGMLIFERRDLPA